MLSIFMLQARILRLSHVTEVSYNCCVNTCCCFTGTYTGLDSCPFCKHAWYNSEGHSYKKYKYLPIEPCIKSLYLTDHYTEVLRYHSLPRDSEVEDVFNGIHYWMLCQTQVMINGAELDHHFFSDIQDVTLGLMLDGFQIFKAQRDGSPTCWPLITLNFNLPPEICMWLTHIIPLSIIPGCQDLHQALANSGRELEQWADGMQSIICMIRCELNLCVGPLVTVAYGVLGSMLEVSWNFSWRWMEMMHQAPRIFRVSTMESQSLWCLSWFPDWG